MLATQSKTKENKNNNIAQNALPSSNNGLPTLQAYNNYGGITTQKASQEMIQNSAQLKESAHYKKIANTSAEQNTLAQLHAIADHSISRLAIQKKQPGINMPGMIYTNPILAEVARNYGGLNIADYMDNGPQAVQLQQGVVQFEGEAMQRLATCTSGLWNIVKSLTLSGHEKKLLPLLLNSLSLMVAAIRFARDDKSVGAQFGTALVSLLTAAEAAWTAVDEWRSATGEGKALWDKRVGAMEKLATVFALLGGTIGVPIDATTGAFIAAAGVGSIKVLRSAYDAFAKWYWPDEAATTPLLGQ